MLFSSKSTNFRDYMFSSLTKRLRFSQVGWNGFAGHIWAAGRSLETPDLNHWCIGEGTRENGAVTPLF